VQELQELQNKIGHGPVEGQESGVRSQESGVRSQESGVRSQESGVQSFVRIRNGKLFRFGRIRALNLNSESEPIFIL
ncbi:MAG: hypothetical protein QOE88_1831, partial [Verrucomicrobiota bacterium]|nr:hypothetical protein [Verrucomicrobiota bacterium]